MILPNVKRYLVALICLAVFAAAPALAQSEPAESFGLIEKILAVVPDWIQVLTLFSVALSALAAVTPTVRDDEWASNFKKVLAKLRRLLDVLGLSVGNANRQSKK